MATHSNILAWRVPWTEEPGRLQSMGLQSQTRLRYSHTHTPPWPPVAARVPLWALRCSMASNGHLSQLKPKVLTLAREALQDLTLVHLSSPYLFLPFTELDLRYGMRTLGCGMRDLVP